MIIDGKEYTHFMLDDGSIIPISEFPDKRKGSDIIILIDPPPVLALSEELDANDRISTVKKTIVGYVNMNNAEADEDTDLNIFRFAFKRGEIPTKMWAAAERMAAEIEKLIVSRDDWERLWELEAAGRRHAEEEIEKLEARNLELRGMLETGDPITEIKCELTAEELEKIKTIINNTKPGAVFPVSEKMHNFFLKMQSKYGFVSIELIKQMVPERGEYTAPTGPSDAAE